MSDLCRHGAPKQLYCFSCDSGTEPGNAWHPATPLESQPIQIERVDNLDFVGWIVFRAVGPNDSTMESLFSSRSDDEVAAFILGWMRAGGLVSDEISRAYREGRRLAESMNG